MREFCPHCYRLRTVTHGQWKWCCHHCGYDIERDAGNLVGRMG